jgi:hydrogenase nickel incorporation protein HypB
MPDGALLVNTARGSLVETKALIAELRTGRISAVLDVFEEEGPGKVPPQLARLDNVLLQPHAAASAVTWQMTMAVIEGDQQTSNDADRIRVTGASAYQINTGKGCHLDANMVKSALEHMSLEDGSILFIENVGNLVCPAEFDLGEAHKVAILSVTEGEDKPLKYPDMFRAADVMIINKIDLLPYLHFDIDRCEAYARQVNPDIRILRTSATTKEGLDAWVKWLTVESALCNLV